MMGPDAGTMVSQIEPLCISFAGQVNGVNGTSDGRRAATDVSRRWLS
jgi:hypothetical protein